MSIYIVNFGFKLPNDVEFINTTSRSNNWSVGLSPFYVGPVNVYDGSKSVNMENLWQYSKVYPDMVDDNEEPSSKYFEWAKSGWSKKRADRYPMGRNAKPLYSYWNGEKLGYVEARKKIYVPLYAEAVIKTDAFKRLKQVYNNCFEQNKTLYLIDFDAHNIPPNMRDYKNLLNNPNIKFGHAYVLGMLLEGELENALEC